MVQSLQIIIFGPCQTLKFHVKGQNAYEAPKFGILDYNSFHIDLRSLYVDSQIHMSCRTCSKQNSIREWENIDFELVPLFSKIK